jgi:hypothetical protein
MENYKCNNCLDFFKTKQQLDRHMNKKNKCTIKTNFQCFNCNKYFRSKYYLKDHIINKCTPSTDIIVKDKSTDIEIAITEILSSTIDVSLKTELLKKHNINLLDDQILKIINSDMNINGKMINLKSCINDPKPHQTVIANITNNTIIKNSHNTTNIMINNFGKEEISYLDTNYFSNLIMNQHIEKGYVQLIKDIYLNKEHPENGTVKIENINNKYALVYDNGKWNTILKYELRERLHKKNYTILKMHYDKLKNTMSVPKREETYAFLKRDDTTDPHMMYVIDKIILLFYNDDEKVV